MFPCLKHGVFVLYNLCDCLCVWGEEKAEDQVNQIYFISIFGNIQYWCCVKILCYNTNVNQKTKQVYLISSFIVFEHENKLVHMFNHIQYVHHMK